MELAAMASGLGRQDLPEALRSATDAGVRLTGAEFGAFFASSEDADGARLDVHSVSGLAAGTFPDEEPVRSTPLFAPTFTGQAAVRIADVLADPRYGHGAAAGAPPGHPVVRSYLAVPVVTGGSTVMGALLFGHSQPGRFDERAEFAAQAVAVHAATAADNGRLLAAAHRARQQAEASARRLGLLQRITALLSTAASTAEIASRVPAALTVALGCSGSHLMLLDAAGDALVGVPSDLFPAAFRRAHARVPLAAGTPSTRAVTTGAPVLVAGSELTDLTGRFQLGTAHLEAVLAVPLLDRQQQPLGALTALWAQESGAEDDVRDLLVAVAAQVSQALERTRLFDAEQRARAEAVESVAALTDLARTLQRSLLPRHLPELEHVQVAVRYQPAVSGAEVGGDWYDVVVDGDGVVTFVIGDVQGHSTTAAGLMGQLRTAVRAYLTEGHDPATALARANSVLVQMESELFATCCLLQLDQRTGALTVATAGHPPPLVLADGGTVEELVAVPGLPLGISGEGGYTASSRRLCGRTRVLMYTDGVVESPARAAQGTERGLAAVRGAAQEHRSAGAEALADRVMAGIPHDLADDAALLVLDYAGPVAQRDEVSTALPATPAAAADARAFVRGSLGTWHADEDVVQNAELVVSELVTNAVTHTGTAPGLVLAREPGLLRISVSDSSTRHPSPRDAEPDAVGGRGMGIVDVLARAWGTTPTGEGKEVWAELPLERREGSTTEGCAAEG
jgi:serine phosphatase RsbU (regulator of sigma subunit)/anti-sigma regulatory factor (Ser/Thr protein kinase)